MSGGVVIRLNRENREAEFASDQWEGPKTRAGWPRVFLRQNGGALELLLLSFDGACSLADAKEKADLVSRALAVAELWSAQ